jgi:hypothetical protein
VLDLVRRPESMLEHIRSEVEARVSGERVITGAFGMCNVEPDDPEPFIVMSATYELDSEAYMWTDVPAPDDPF